MISGDDYLVHQRSFVHFLLAKEILFIWLRRAPLRSGSFAPPKEPRNPADAG
jgi:hypothetical protein